MKLSRIGLLGFICVAMTAWVVWSAPRSPQSEVRVVASSATNRVIIYPGPTDTLTKVTGLGVTNVVAYGSYWLAEATEAQIVQAVGAATVTSNIELTFDQGNTMDGATRALNKEELLLAIERLYDYIVHGGLNAQFPM